MELELTLLLFLAIFPVFVALAYVYSTDFFNKEPKFMLGKALFFGALLSVPLIIIETPLILGSSLIPNPIFSAISVSFIGAAIPEEVGKFLVVYWLIWKSPHFDERYDGIVYAVFVSMGFAGVENILYIWGAAFANDPNGINPIFLSVTRAIFSVPLHFFCAVILGYYMSIAKFDTVYKMRYIVTGLFWAILFHGVFNSLLFINQVAISEFTGLLFGAFIVLNIFLWKFGNRRIRHLSGLLAFNQAEKSALIKCPNCGTMSLSDISVCPNCQHALSSDFTSSVEKSA